MASNNNPLAKILQALGHNNNGINANNNVNAGVGDTNLNGVLMQLLQQANAQPQQQQQQTQQGQTQLQQQLQLQGIDLSSLLNSNNANNNVMSSGNLQQALASNPPVAPQATGTMLTQNTTGMAQLQAAQQQQVQQQQQDQITAQQLQLKELQLQQQIQELQNQQQFLHRQIQEQLNKKQQQQQTTSQPSASADGSTVNHQLNNLVLQLLGQTSGATPDQQTAHAQALQLQQQLQQLEQQQQLQQQQQVHGQQQQLLGQQPQGQANQLLQSQLQGVDLSSLLGQPQQNSNSLQGALNALGQSQGGQAQASANTGGQQMTDAQKLLQLVMNQNQNQNINQSSQNLAGLLSGSMALNGTNATGNAAAALSSPLQNVASSLNVATQGVQAPANNTNSSSALGGLACNNAAAAAAAGLMQLPQQQPSLAANTSVVSVSSGTTATNSGASGNISASGDASRTGAASIPGQANAPSNLNGVDTSYPMTNIEYPGQNDCMFGRGGGTSNHIGNIRFRLLVEKFKKRYAEASKFDKPKVAEEVVTQWRVQKPPGRFLARTDPNDGNMSLWHDVGNLKARRKCAQALREKASRCRDESCDTEPPTITLAGNTESRTETVGQPSEAKRQRTE